jgi:diadenosine tetraphosphate (Ap4A) HIT family hydrolase
MSIFRKFISKNSELIPNTQHTTPGLTIFACPKPFTNPHIAIIQRNAIISWTLLRPRTEIILFGDEEGTAEICQELGLRHLREIVRNEFGTPVLNDIFEKAQQLANYEVLCYVNADIILMSDLIHAINQISQWQKSFLMVGQRWDLDMRELLDFSKNDWEEHLRVLAMHFGNKRLPNLIDYFVFPKGLFTDIPPFVIGRYLSPCCHCYLRASIVVDKMGTTLDY